jgi:hypothetical protein
MPPDRRSHSVALRNRMRAASWAFVGALATDVALMVIHFVFQWPTTEHRARLYSMLATSPIRFGVVYGLVLYFAGGVVTRFAGWRGVHASLGVAAAALATLSLLESGIFSRVVWLHAADVTADGASTRVAVSILLATIGFLVSRAAARRIGSGA